jgi:hypothetical protein
MTVWLQSCPSLQLLQSFFQNIALKGYLTQRWMATLSQFYRKNVLTKCRPSATIKFSLWSINETFPRGGAWLFRWGAKILKGGAKRSQGRCAPPHTSPQNPTLGQIKLNLNLKLDFVCFSSIGMAKAALESLNGFNLFGSQVLF